MLTIKNDCLRIFIKVRKLLYQKYDRIKYDKRRQRKTNFSIDVFILRVFTQI